MNIDEILKYQRPKETLYDRLGCHQSSTVSILLNYFYSIIIYQKSIITDYYFLFITFQIEQINREYKIRALQLHPDKNTDPNSLEKFRSIQEAKDILTDESSRKSYDSWLDSRINVPFEQWHKRKTHSMHWINPKSTKLSIKEEESTGQGSDFKQQNNTPDNWLKKFRRYEI